MKVNISKGLHNMIKDKEYYEGLDKRTSEYKTWAKFNKLGNGDALKLTPYTTYRKKGGDNKREDIDWDAVNDVWGSKPKEPKQILRPFNKLQFQVYGMYRDNRTLNVWNDNDIDLLVSLYAHVYSIQYHSKNLTKESKGAFKNLTNMSKELDIAYETYKRDLSDLKMK